MKHKRRNIVLIGFMGSGKTTLGLKLSYLLRMPVEDTDKLIERQEGRSITQIFADDGESYFRELETELLRKCGEQKYERILSVGGGTPVNPVNRPLLHQCGTVVYLRVSPEVVYERLKNDTTRPLLQCEDPLTRIRELLEILLTSEGYAVTLASSGEQALQLLSPEQAKPKVACAKVYAIEGNGVTGEMMEAVAHHVINPVEARRASMEKLEMQADVPADVAVIEGFTQMSDKALGEMVARMGMAMSAEDLCFCRDYFRDTEKRDPSVTELRAIDTYWSDHCRHTTFLTAIDEITFDDGRFAAPVKAAYELYVETRKDVYGARKKDISLMDMAKGAAQDGQARRPRRFRRDQRLLHRRHRERGRQGRAVAHHVQKRDP